MQDFTVNSILTKKEYKSYTLLSFYKTPVIIGITILGIVIIVIVLLQLLKIIHIYEDIPWLGFLFGVALLLLPLNTVRGMANKTFPHSAITKVVDYRFGIEGINAETAFSKAFFGWSSIIKVDQTKNFLILKQANKSAFFVKKDLLSEQQIEFIHSKVLKT